MRKAISVVKTRTTDHERTIREFRVDPSGLSIGAPLRGFHGILSGAPVYRGDTTPSMHPDAAPRARRGSDGLGDG